MKSPELKNDVAAEEDVEDTSAAPWSALGSSDEVSGFSTMGLSSILGEFFELLAVVQKNICKHLKIYKMIHRKRQKIYPQISTI